MTHNRKLKRQARQRQLATGEPYATAQRHVMQMYLYAQRPDQAKPAVPEPSEGVGTTLHELVEQGYLDVPCTDVDVRAAAALPDLDAHLDALYRAGRKTETEL